MVNRLTKKNFVSLILIGFIAQLSMAAAPYSDVNNLGLGHKKLLNMGLQIQGTEWWQDGSSGFEWATFDQMHQKTVFLFNRTGAHTLSNGTDGLVETTPFPLGYPFDMDSFQWGRNDNGEGLTLQEKGYIQYLANLQYKDEQGLENPMGSGFKSSDYTDAVNWLIAKHTDPNFDDTLLYINQYAGFFDVYAAAGTFEDFLGDGQPDIIMYDYYPFGHSGGGPNGGSPTQHYYYMAYVRDMAMDGVADNGNTVNNPIPYGLYTQGYIATSNWPSESEIRLNHFSAWAFGYKLSSLFQINQIGMKVPNQPMYSWYAENNRQGKLLGPSLVRLFSTDVRLVRGQHKEGASTVTNDKPSNVDDWNSSADPYITSITATNLGSLNDGLRGDIAIGYFNVLAEDLDGVATDELYFMIVNGLSAPIVDVNNPSGFADETQQQIVLQFGSLPSGVGSILRINRNTGQVEDLKLSAADSLTIVLDGGTGDLFKLNTGAKFVGVPFPSQCGDEGTTYQSGDIDKDCDIDMSDLSAMVAGWLDCTDPEDTNCQ